MKKLIWIGKPTVPVCFPFSSVPEAIPSFPEIVLIFWFGISDATAAATLTYAALVSTLYLPLFSVWICLKKADKEDLTISHASSSPRGNTTFCCVSLAFKEQILEYTFTISWRIFSGSPRVTYCTYKITFCVCVNRVRSL